MAESQSIKSNLHRVFSIKDLGRLDYFLGLEVSYTAEGIVLTQQKFTNDLLHDSGLCSFKKVVTPLLVISSFNQGVPLFIMIPHIIEV